MISFAKNFSNFDHSPCQLSAFYNNSLQDILFQGKKNISRENPGTSFMGSPVSLDKINLIAIFEGNYTLNSGEKIINNDKAASGTKMKQIAKKKKAKEKDFAANFKTEICKYWEENGFCPFADKCAFAHGDNEIRQRKNVVNGYKAKKCIHFHQEGYCPYGRRCQFLHSLRANVEAKTSLSYQEKMNDPCSFEILEFNCICDTRPRLPIFEGFTAKEQVCSSSSYSGSCCEQPLN